ncbi:MAG: hypothetical protein QMC83_02565 [Thermodesulfovibrionales bacterium]|nr:hypothetical protein [Thermodesulfovibrionales bacterium]
MAIKHKGHFTLGVILSLSFLVLLVLIFLPIFPESPEGKRENGLEYADRMFNRLSKGSSYFIPKLTKGVEDFVGETFSVSIEVDKPEEAEKVAKLFTTAGATVNIEGARLKTEGDLGKTLQAVLKDADAMYHNEGAKVSGLYGYDEKKVMKDWWKALGKIEKVFKKEKKVKELKIVSDVNKKAVETAYNYYGIMPQKVKERAGLMTFLLVFYVVYTMWWGFSVFFLFEGIGLSMKKAKVKKEV